MVDAWFDVDGRLHCAAVPISKAAINAYRGSEIIDGADEIDGLVEIDPDKVYRLWRPAAELAKSAKSFCNLPITDRHVFAMDKLNDALVGTTGSHVTFCDPYLLSDAVIWSQSGIDGIASGQKSCPSIGYRFAVVMTPGTFNGERYDGRIIGRSRAGDDIYFSPPACGRDCLPFEFEGARSP
jgi:uncharacterized protein